MTCIVFLRIDPSLHLYLLISKLLNRQLSVINITSPYATQIISDSRIRHIVSKSLKYRFPSNTDFKKYREEITSTLNDFGDRWCKRQHAAAHALKTWKVNIFKIVDKRIKFYSQKNNLLPPKPKSTFRHLQHGIQEFHRKYVLCPADKAV